MIGSRSNLQSEANICIGLVCLFLLQVSFAQNDLVITPSSDFIQTQASYLINMTAQGVSPIPANSTITLNFPSAYQSLPSQSYVCTPVSWPISLPSGLTCVIAYGILTVSGGFPLPYSNFTNTVAFIWAVSSVTNPLYAQTTDYFQGSVVDSGGNLIFQYFPVSGLGLTMRSGKLSKLLSY